MILSENTAAYFSDPVFMRRDLPSVREAASHLGVSVPRSIVEFYERYRGPFASPTTGFEVLDLVDGNPNVVSATEDCRQYHGLEDRFLVLSDLLASAVVVVDSVSSLMYVVDFDGGIEMLASGALPPRWSSFEAFLEELFRAVA